MPPPKNRKTHKNPKSPRSRLICLCNGVCIETVEAAIADGAKTVDQVGDRTMAGFGACGGSCRPEIFLLIEKFNQK